MDSVERSGDGASLSFGELLVRFRSVAGVTQEGLAEASGMSVRALRDVERGRTRAVQRRSAEVLADALGLAGDDRELFLVRAREGRRREPRPVVGRAGTLSGVPPAVPDLVGREGELARLREFVADGGTVAVVGQPGVGKTALAVSAAYGLRSEFPDGCVWVDLRGMDEQPVTVRAALERLLRGLGVAASEMPAAEEDQLGLYRKVLTGRRMLVVLDNAANETQVRPLVAAAPGCVTLVTCRQALAGLAGVRWVWLEPLADGDSTELLAGVVGTDRVRAEPDAAAELVSLCGGLPLAVRIVGNRLATRPHWSMGYLAELLRDERIRLSALSVGDLQVRSAFEVSYRRLSPSAQVVFRRLAALPGVDFGVELAEIATGVSGPQMLDELADASLVHPLAEGRFQFHDLLRLFSLERWEAEEQPADRERVTRAVLEYLLDTTSSAALMFFPTKQETAGFSSDAEAEEWLVAEESNWIAAHREAARLGWHRTVLELASALHWYAGHRWLGPPWEELYRLGLAAARALGDQSGEAELLNLVGWGIAIGRGDHEAAAETHRDALTVAIEAGNRVEEVWAHAYLSSQLRSLGRLDEALDHARQAGDLAADFDFWEVQINVRFRLGWILYTMGRYEDALSVQRALLADTDRHLGDKRSKTRRISVTFVKEGVANCLVAMGDWQQAAETFRETRQERVELGSDGNVAVAALDEGRAWLRAKEYVRARECFEYALEGFGDQAPPHRRAQVLAELAKLPGE